MRRFGNSNPQDLSTIIGGKRRTARDLLLVFDILLVALFCLAPLAMGGRHEIGKTIFLALTGATVLVWLVRAMLQKQCGWHWTGAEPILAGALALILVQLTSIPAEWLDVLSPELRDSLPVWWSNGKSSFSLGTWHTISIAPSVTQTSLLVYVAYAALFCVIAQRLETMDDVYRLLKLIAAASIFMAVVGLMQFVSGSTEYLGLYHHPARSAAGKVTGSFTNQNHYANFVTMGVGPLVWWTCRAKLRTRRHQQASFLFPLSMLGIVVLSVLLSFSRGGVLVLAVAVSAAAVTLGRRGLLNRRAIAVIAVCVAVLGIALFIHGYSPLADRLGTLLPGQSIRDASRERWDLWAADWQAAKDFTLFGAGAGTHAEVYPRYMSAQYNVRFTHAENSYLQILLETGIVGLALTIAGILIVLGWCIRVLRHAQHSVDAALAAGLLASVCATLAHAVADFAWYIPACMTMTIGILAAACRASQLLPVVRTRESNQQPPLSEQRSALPIPRPVWAVLATSVMAIAILATPQRIGAACGAVHWDRYLRQSSASSNVLLHDTAEARAAVEKLIHHLSHTVRNDPRHPQAWQRLSALNMRRFALEQRDADNAMDSAQLRDAVFASNFASQKAADQWLSRAIGDNMRYLRQAVACAREAAQLGAWRGEAYLYLAELSFLIDTNRHVRDALLTQAQYVRPYDGAVMFAIGVEDLQQGHAERAMKRWKLVFHRNEELRMRIIEHLGPQSHPLVLIEAFAPGADSLQQLFEIHRAQGQKEFAAVVGKYLEPALVRRAQQTGGETAASVWSQIADVTWYLDEQQRSLRYLARAVEIQPDQYEWRRRLADRLCAAQDFAGAAAQYRLCLEHTPYDESLQRALLAAEKRRIEQSASARSAGHIHQR